MSQIKLINKVFMTLEKLNRFRIGRKERDVIQDYINTLKNKNATCKCIYKIPEGKNLTIYYDIAQN